MQWVNTLTKNNESKIINVSCSETRKRKKEVKYGK